MPYVPIHDRVSNLANSPRYASPDLDPHAPLKMSDREPEPESQDDYEQEYEHEEEEYDAGPSRKRRREDDYDGQSHHSNGRSQSQSLSSSSRRPAPPPVERITMETPIQPSIFGIAPRNEFTKTIGEFIMAHCRGVENVEIEIKLGTLNAAAPEGQPQRRVRMATRTELSE